VEKKERQDLVADLLRRERLSNQTELVKRLKKSGIRTTQASVSRDLTEMGVVKVDGVYQLPQLSAGQSMLLDRLRAERAGDHMVVLRTGPGHAQMAALYIDRAKIQEVIGTIAGDDTIFVAVADAEAQARAVRKIFALFGHTFGASASGMTTGSRDLNGSV
jgi:transcriptional regulator of arginine metabolism